MSRYLMSTVMASGRLWRECWSIATIRTPLPPSLRHTLAQGKKLYGLKATQQESFFSQQGGTTAQKDEGSPEILMKLNVFAGR